MEISAKNECAFKKLRCYLTSDERGHFLTQPKILPCGNLACDQCVKDAISTGVDLACKLCGTEHNNLDYSSLDSGDNLVDMVNADDLTEEMEARVISQVNMIKDTLSNKQDILETVCTQAKNEITKRVQIVKDHLEKLQQELFDKLETIKTNTNDSLILLNGRAKETVDNCQKVTENMRQMLKNFDESRDQIFKEMHECQDHVNDLNRLNEKLRLVLRKVIFEPSNWLPDEKFIFPPIDHFKVHDQKSVCDK